MALKLREPALALDQSGVFKVSPDEMDRYEVVNMRPATNVDWFVTTIVAGTSASRVGTVANRLPDYPRNLLFSITGTHGSTAGTLNASGKDQFGNTITETILIPRADNGGTTSGTKVFAQFVAGTVNFGTAVGNGTARIGFDPSTSCLLGLPIKLGTAADVVHLGCNIGTGAVTYGGGTIAAYVNVAQSAISPVATLDGTQVISCWIKPSYDSSQVKSATQNIAKIANLSQIT